MATSSDYNAPSSSSTTSSSSSCSSECDCPPMDEMDEDMPMDDSGDPGDDGGDDSSDDGGGGNTGSSSSSTSSSSSYTRRPIRYSNGEIRQIQKGLTMRGYGQRWGHTLSYGNRIDTDYNGVNGYRWFIKEFPQAGKDASGNVQIIGIINDGIWFNKSGANYVARFFSKETLTEDTTNKEFAFTDHRGQVWKFFSYDVSIAAAKQGQFKNLTDPAGNVTTPTYDVNNRITQFVMGGSPTTGYYYDYFTAGNNAGKLQYVTLKRGSTNIRRIEFQYYDNGDSNGNLGDLKLAIEQTWSGSTWDELGRTYKRYYKSNDPGEFVHGLKYLINAEGYTRMQAAGFDPLTASDSDLGKYADRYFAYSDSTEKRVTLEVVSGTKPPPSSSTTSYAYAYTYSGNSGPNSWKGKNEETLPGGDRLTAYTNDSGQPILKVFERMSDNAVWGEYYQYDTARRMTLKAESSAINLASLNEGAPGLVSLNTSTGLIRLYEYYTTTDLPNGAVTGLLQYEKVKQGTSGTAVTVKEYKYTSRTAGTKTIYPLWKETAYQSDASGGSTPVETAYTYTYFSGTVQIEQKTTTWPTVSTGQNGSGSPTSRIERFDVYGNRIWLKDERGFLTRFKHDLPTGAIVQRIDDVSGSSLTDAPTMPSGWSTPLNGGLHLITDLTVDNLGRTTQSLGPAHPIDISGTSTTVRRAQWAVYKDSSHELRYARGYGVGSSSISSYTLIEPITVRKYDRSGRVTDQIATKRATGVTGVLTATEDVATQSRWVRWRKYIYGGNESRPLAKRVYFLIPTSGEGDATNNYSETLYDYDAEWRLRKITRPGGTIIRFVYHAKGWLQSKWIGTDDTGATDSDPSAGGSNSMRKIVEYAYDSGSSGGDGLLSTKTLFENDSGTRVTNFLYDFRLRRTRKTGELNSRQDYSYDNQDRLTKVELINAATSVLIGRAEFEYDNRGRRFRSKRYGVNVSTGAVGNALIENTWFDQQGQIIKKNFPGSSALNKFAYDGVGRLTHQYLTHNTGDTTYGTAVVITTDTVMRQRELAYDAASNLIRRTTRQRFHDSTGTGALKLASGTQPLARVSYEAFWPDALGRVGASANYGTNGASGFSRPATVPIRSDTILITSRLFNAAGELEEVTDSAGNKTKTVFDHAGRLTSRIEDEGNSPHLNRETQYVYNVDGRLRHLVAKNSITGDQITKFVYGTTLSDSDIASNELLRAKIYPDSTDSENPLSGTDHVEYKVNRLGEIKELKDQIGTVHIFDYDKLGRLQHDRISTLGSNVDGAVRRITQSFEARGLLEKITSYDNQIPGSGNVVNEVQYAYNDFSQVTREYQSHSGPVNTGTTPKVEYDYTNGSANHVRHTSVTYPDGRVSTFDYGLSNGNDDLLSRINSLKHGATSLAEYSYMGLDRIIRNSYIAQPGVELTYIKQGAEPNGDAGDQYTGLDRFGRVVDQRWLKTSDGTHRERLKYGYDRVSSPTWRQNVVAVTGQDEFYTYDTLYQLKSLDRGTLTGTPPTGISGTPSWEEDLNYDATGNWKGGSSGYLTKVNGATTLNQNRTHNKANEIDGISTTVGTAWSVPTEDAVGNMTSLPQPSSLGASYSAKYDSWNRLVQLNSGSVGAYAYDGLHRRTTKSIGGNVRHFYYSYWWQILEERLNASSVADRQFVWGLRYRDDLVLRDKGAERLYVLHDLFHITAVVNTSGTVQERYGYNAFGASRVMDSAFASRISTLYEWETRFGAHRWDSETELLVMRFRLYHPNLGRWITRDLIQYTDGNNLYCYCRNSPIKRIDLFGLQPDAKDLFDCHVTLRPMTPPEDMPEDMPEDEEPPEDIIDDDDGWEESPMTKPPEPPAFSPPDLPGDIEMEMGEAPKPSSPGPGPMRGPSGAEDEPRMEPKPDPNYPGTGMMIKIKIPLG